MILQYDRGHLKLPEYPNYEESKITGECVIQLCQARCITVGNWVGGGQKQ